MLGLLYIPKYRGEKQPFQIGKVVNIVFGELCNRDPSCPFGIIMSPGYMSTTKNTIQEYIDKFFKEVKNSGNFQQLYAAIFIGMNGCVKVKKQSNTILEQHSIELNLRKINPLVFKFKTKNKDHRKMLFFFTFKSVHKKFLPSIVAKTDIDSFMNNISVEYLMIGSSNQSKSTYYSRTASHGEADVLFFTNKDFEKRIKDENLLINDDDYLNGCVLSKVEEQPGFDSSQYLNEILKDFLNNNLE